MKIYRDFGSFIAKINANPPLCFDMRKMSLGRAYRKASGIYSNEIHVAIVGEPHHVETQQELKQDLGENMPLIYAGTAGLVNFGYIAALKPAGVILWDVNYAQSVFWTIMIEALAKNETLQDFLTFLKDSPNIVTDAVTRSLQKSNTEFFTASESTPGPYIRHNIYPYRLPRNIEEWIEDALNNNDDSYIRGDLTWLTDDAYATLHTLAKNNAIGVLTLDITHMRSFDQLAGELKKAPLELVDTDKPDEAPTIRSNPKIDIMYISNIFAFLSRSHDWTRRKIFKPLSFVDNLAYIAQDNIMKVTHSGSIIIDGMKKRPR
ncbi:MAG: hypothetical protein GC136_10360 [Alphaproteobacteria bacterium]|nr:hypothetical protein [Alphaproteobacteria bacterium]